MSKAKRYSVGILLILIGVLVLLYYGSQLSFFQSAKNWPTVTGTVTDSKYSLNGKKESTVEYTYDAKYTVNGQQYELRMNSKSSPKQGETKIVSYDPSNPEKSVVLADANYFLNILYMLGGLFLMAVGVFIIIQAKKSAGNSIKNNTQAQPSTNPTPAPASPPTNATTGTATKTAITPQAQQPQAVSQPPQPYPTAKSSNLPHQ